LTPVGEDEGLTPLEWRVDVRARGLLKELRRDDLLEGFVALRDVIHDVISPCRSAVGAVLKLTIGRVLLARRREPDLTSRIAFRPDAARYRIQVFE
jgi:hypothetical protein